MSTYQNLDFNATNLYIGFNIHKKNWEVVIRCNGIQLKRFNMEAWALGLYFFINGPFAYACGRQMINMYNYVPVTRSIAAAL